MYPLHALYLPFIYPVYSLYTIYTTRVYRYLPRSFWRSPRGGETVSGEDKVRLAAILRAAGHPPPSTLVFVTLPLFVCNSCFLSLPPFVYNFDPFVYIPFTCPISTLYVTCA